MDETKRDGLYDIRIWNHEGDLVKVFWSVTDDGVDEIRKEYENEPLLTVTVDECH